MRKSSHIITVGTSILTNYIRKYGAPPGGGLPDLEPLLSFVKERPGEASAELSALLPHLEAGGVDEVYLIYTETDKGYLCHRVLARFMQDRGIQINYKSVPGVGPGEPEERFIAGLKDLVEYVCRFVRHRLGPDRDVFLNATGGYKPESGFLVLVANALGCRVYYRHETMDRPVELPLLLPVRLGKEILGLLRELRSNDGRQVLQQAFPCDEILHEAESRRLISLKRDDSGIAFEVRLTEAGKLALAVYGERE